MFYQYSQFVFPKSRVRLTEAPGSFWYLDLCSILINAWYAGSKAMDIIVANAASFTQYLFHINICKLAQNFGMFVSEDTYSPFRLISNIKEP